MAARRPLVNVSGSTQELPVGDTLTGASGGGPDSNLISSAVVIAADTSYIIASYLKITSTNSLTVNGILMVIG